MKTVVIYKSKTGFTKKYAKWISERLDADLFIKSKVKLESLLNYDVIVYGGSLYATGILGVKLITKNIEKLKDKLLVVFATGASPNKEEAINDILASNFTEKDLDKIKFFYFRGGFNFNKLNIFDKFLMLLLKMKLKFKKNLNSDEKGMLNSYQKPLDFTKKENVNELISFIQSQKSNSN